MTSQLIEDPGLRHRLTFEEIAGADGERAVRVEMWVDPGGGVPPHLHPRQEERFEVLEGRCQFLGGRRWQEAGPGETVVVPPGTRHAYRNRGDVTAHVVCTATPPATLEGFLTDAAALGRAKLLTRGGLPKSPRALLAVAAMVDAYGEDVVLGFPPLPPQWLQRLVIPPLARVAARRGYRAGRFAEDPRIGAVT